MRVFDIIVTFGPGTLLMYHLLPAEIQRRETATLTDAGQQARQEAGIAALLSLASSVASTTPIPVVSARPHPPPTVAYEGWFR